MIDRRLSREGVYVDPITVCSCQFMNFWMIQPDIKDWVGSEGACTRFYSAEAVIHEL